MEIEWVPESTYTDKMSLTSSTNSIPDVTRIAALASRPNATPELIRESIKVMSELGVDGISLGHYDGAHMEHLDAVGQGIRDAGTIVTGSSSSIQAGPTEYRDKEGTVIKLTLSGQEVNLSENTMVGVPPRCARRARKSARGEQTETKRKKRKAESGLSFEERNGHYNEGFDTQIFSGGVNLVYGLPDQHARGRSACAGHSAQNRV